MMYNVIYRASHPSHVITSHANARSRTPHPGSLVEARLPPGAYGATRGKLLGAQICSCHPSAPVNSPTMGFRSSACPTIGTFPCIRML